MRECAYIHGHVWSINYVYIYYLAIRNVNLSSICYYNKSKQAGSNILDLFGRKGRA